MIFSFSGCLSKDSEAWTGEEIATKMTSKYQGVKFKLVSDTVSSESPQIRDIVLKVKKYDDLKVNAVSKLTEMYVDGSSFGWMRTYYDDFPQKYCEFKKSDIVGICSEYGFEEPILENKKYGKIAVYLTAKEETDNIMAASGVLKLLDLMKPLQGSDYDDAEIKVKLNDETDMYIRISAIDIETITADDLLENNLIG